MDEQKNRLDHVLDITTATDAAGKKTWIVKATCLGTGIKIVTEIPYAENVKVPSVVNDIETALVPELKNRTETYLGALCRMIQVRNMIAQSDNPHEKAVGILSRIVQSLAEKKTVQAIPPVGISLS